MDLASTTITLLDFAVSCLGRIQLAREFEHDFAKHQLQLNILQVRLTRWGELAGIKAKGDDTNASSQPMSERAQSADKLLTEIRDLFEAAQEQADKVKSKAAVSKDAPADEPLDPQTNMTARLKRIQGELGQWVDRRMANVKQKATQIQWMFYKKDAFEKFVADLAELITALEDLFPQETREEQLGSLSKKECEDINNTNLQTLQEYVDGCDPWFASAAKEKLQNGRSAGVSINQSHNVGQTTGIHNGNVNGVSNGNGNKTTNYWGKTG